MIRNKSELYDMLNRLNDIMPNKDFNFNFAYDMVKLESGNGSKDESGFMSKKQLLEWMRAYKAGFYACKDLYNIPQES